MANIEMLPPNEYLNSIDIANDCPAYVVEAPENVLRNLEGIDLNQYRNQSNETPKNTPNNENDDLLNEARLLELERKRRRREAVNAASNNSEVADNCDPPPEDYS